MADTTPNVFDTAISDANAILNEIGETFNWSKDESYSALRAVLHTLRDRLPAGNAVNFASQLPLLIKGIYYDGWQPDKVPIKMDKDDFLWHVDGAFQTKTNVTTEDVIKIVLTVIMNRIDKGEVENIKNVLPSDIKSLIEL